MLQPELLMSFLDKYIHVPGPQLYSTSGNVEHEFRSGNLVQHMHKIFVIFIANPSRQGGIQYTAKADAFQPLTGP